MRLTLTFLSLFLFASLSFAQQKYDLLLKNGHVIDPKNKISERRDVAVSGGKIAAVERAIDASTAAQVVDLNGFYVTPGLVGIHVHLYTGTGMKSLTGDQSVYPDGFSFRSCVTTMADAGSSGWHNFEDFKQRVIDRAKTRVFAFVNIVGQGMGGGAVEQDVNDMNAQRAADIVKQYPETVVGIKTAHYAKPGWEAVDRALEAGRLGGVPVMIDFGEFRPERPHQELILNKMRPGDIYTHTYLGRVSMLDENNRVRPYLFEGQKRGVIFDVGHGAGSFIFRYAVPAMQQGFTPDSISTDLHTSSMNGGMKDMTNVMSKFLNMGMSLDEVILKSTWNPAREIRREQHGHIGVGALADIAVLRIDQGDFGFVDVERMRMPGKQRLACEMTVLNGNVVFDLNGRSSELWDRKIQK